MKLPTRHLGRIGAGLLFIGLVSGCASDMTMIVAKPPVNAQKLGYVEGTGMGALGVTATGYYFIPMGLNSRVERAYMEALGKAPGATALMNVTLEEDWFWFGIGTMRRVKITGEAVK